MNINTTITEIQIDNVSSLNALTALSTDASRHNSPNWLATVSDAKEELRRSVVPENVSLMALANENPAGWVSAFPVNHQIWEIHPLLVDPNMHRNGIETLLVREIERTLISRGVRIIQVSTSDATSATSISDKDLFVDPIGELQKLRVKNPKDGHAYQFWVRVGYEIVGVMPDAEGIGVPSINLAKRIVPLSAKSD